MTTVYDLTSSWVEVATDRALFIIKRVGSGDLLIGNAEDDATARRLTGPDEIGRQMAQLDAVSTYARATGTGWKLAASLAGEGRLPDGMDEATALAAEVELNSAARHTQGTDQGLDTGGPNAVTAADAADLIAKSFDGEVMVNPNRPDRAGITYQEFTDAGAYIEGLGAGTYKINLVPGNHTSGASHTFDTANQKILIEGNQGWVRNASDNAVTYLAGVITVNSSSVDVYISNLQCNGIVVTDASTVGLEDVKGVSGNPCLQVDGGNVSGHNVSLYALGAAAPFRALKVTGGTCKLSALTFGSVSGASNTYAADVTGGTLTISQARDDSGKGLNVTGGTVEVGAGVEDMPINVAGGMVTYGPTFTGTPTKDEHAVPKGFADTNYMQVERAEVKTTDATSTTLWSHTLDDNSTYTIEAIGSAINKTVDDSVGFELIGAFKRRGGAAVLLTGGIKVKIPAASTLDMALAVSGNDAQLNVTGDATPNDVNWKVQVAIQKVAITDL